VLVEIESIMSALQEPDHECFNEEAIHQPVWQRLRELATEGLRAFGWEHTKPEPFREVEPGVWRRGPGNPADPPRL
jgi:hypothetical protein